MIRHYPARFRPGTLTGALVAALIAGCSSSGGPDSTPLPTPLPTTAAHGSRLCKLLGRASVETAIGRSNVAGKGSVRDPSAATHAGALLATCAVSFPGDGESDALDVTVRRVATSSVDIVRAARSGGAAFVYPREIGVGFANHETYHDASGRQYLSTVSGVIRGDWAITLSLQTPGRGRDPLADTVALVQQVIAALHLSAHPSRPYPAPLASALHS